MDEKEKVLSLVLVAKDGSLSLFGIDPRRSGEDPDSVIELSNMKGLSRHNNMCFYGTTVLGSKIYFIGGLPTVKGFVGPPDRRSLNAVSIYDTISDTWLEGPCLNVGRSNMASVIVYGTKIYVFGNGLRPLEPVSVNHWVECYDTQEESPQWRIIPGPPSHLFAHQFAINDLPFDVVHFRDEVRFWAKRELHLLTEEEVRDDEYHYHRRLFVFYLPSETWMPAVSDIKFPYPSPFLFPPPILDYFNTNHVVYGNYAIWHYFGHAYAWDLTTDKTWLLCKLPDNARWWRQQPRHYRDMRFFPYEGHLLHLGKDLMCIVYFGVRNMMAPSVDCYTFRINGDPFKTTSEEDGVCHLSISSAATPSFRIPGTIYICEALALSADFVPFGTKETENETYGESSK